MIHYYKDSADATVAVEELRAQPGQPRNQVILRINGKTDASSRGDLATQYLLAHLPLAAKPDATNVFVLGFGSGITGGALLGHPIDRITIAENTRPVLEAGEHFAQWNRGVLTNSRVQIRTDDARAVLKLNPTKYDVIINEPSNPWVAGIGSVFSKEFYDLCASRLSDDGIVAQWFHIYEMSDYIVFLVLRTFAATFPYMEVWDTQEGDIVLLGSKKAWKSNPAQYQKIFDRPEVMKDFKELSITTGVTLWARQIASQKTAFAIAGDGPIQTDDFPILEYAAPRAFFMGAEAHRLTFFDERTMQFPLADAEKIATLRALPKHILLNSFEFSSCNSDMRIYLGAIRETLAGGANRLDPMGHLIFRDASSYPQVPTVSTNASPEFAELQKLEATILRDMQNWAEPAARVQQILVSLIEKNMLTPPDFKPGYFAAFITRCAIGAGDFNSAFRFLQLGMIFGPEQEQLLFLSRVLDRIVPPEILEQFKREDAARNPTLQ
jgi:spermidine synthase